MKKVIVGITTIVCATLLVLSCEKEVKPNVSPVGTTGKEKPAGDVTNHTKGPIITMSGVWSKRCGERTTCAIPMMGSVTSNSLKVTNTTGYPPYGYLVYTFYKRIGVSGLNETFQPIGQLSCPSHSVEFASYQIENGGVTYVIGSIQPGPGQVNPPTTGTINRHIFNGVTGLPPNVVTTWGELRLVNSNHKGQDCGLVVGPL